MMYDLYLYISFTEVRTRALEVQNADVMRLAKWSGSLGYYKMLLSAEFNHNLCTNCTNFYTILYMLCHGTARIDAAVVQI